MFLNVIGKGAFGKVWRAKHRATGQILAIKQLSKIKLIKKKSVLNVMNEFYILKDLKSPFVVSMLYAFQDKESLYIAMPAFAGGDLRYHMSNTRVFTEEEIKFLAACVLLGLETIHSCNLMHKDIKPENILIDEKGYAYITDFGISKFWRPDNRHENAGTPPYMAPEVLAKEQYSFSVDFYALGIMLYEFITGMRPYRGKTRKEIRDQIASKQATIQQNLVIGRISPEAIDLCNALIQRKREKRLGENGIEEIKRHPWFKGFNWGLLKAKALSPPFVPKASDENYDRLYVSKADELFDASDLEMLKLQSIQVQFRGFKYNHRMIDFRRQRSSVIFDKENIAYQ